ncbi:MAG: porphobilinogen synthase [Gemmatimonadota bacterium]|nr:MAG: porphobilinogen synthase [Gemmatimonadota bacterium]
MASFPDYRPRRLRRSEALRGLIRETSLGPEHLVLPFFVVPGDDVRQPVDAMPGVERLSVDHLVREAGEAQELGIPAVLLFGIPPTKDEVASSAYSDDGIVQQAVRALKAAHPELVVVTDVCLCQYTSHGHCGVLVDDHVDNDATLDLLARTSVSHADAGADIVAPSDMMDGRVGAIRDALEDADHPDVAIMSYAAKYASAFYGPFREAADSAPGKGDRRGYQMDPANADEALREVFLDLDEGADIVMVKPALPYLDIIRRVKTETGYPVAAYQVSGEYSMVRAAGERGWLDAEATLMESLLSIRRAGADIVITYWAREFARISQKRL